jgi:hypothetical protein
LEKQFPQNTQNKKHYNTRPKTHKTTEITLKKKECEKKTKPKHKKSLAQMLHTPHLHTKKGEILTTTQARK